MLSILILSLLGSPPIAATGDQVLRPKFEGTRSTSAMRLGSERLFGCALTFEADTIDRDDAHHQLISVRGDLIISLMAKPDGSDTLGFVVEINPSDLSFDKEEKATFVAFTPKLATVLDSVGRPIDSVKLGDKVNRYAGRSVTYEVSKEWVEMWMRIVPERKIVVGFDRPENHHVISLPIDLTVERINEEGVQNRSLKTLSAWSHCAEELLKDRWFEK